MVVKIIGGTMKEHRQVTEILCQVKKNLPVGSKIIIACSGGADSLALTDALLMLQEEREYQLVACHVEHGLRGSEALADADFVAEFCRVRQLICEVVRVDAKKMAADSRLSLEDAARKLRYTALFECLSKYQADYIVTAHHRDDQAETLLLHLLRGSGAAGLSGMRTYNNCVVRPFLQVNRQTLETYCALRDLPYRIDSSNMDLYYTRNKVRHVLLPLLAREFNPNIRQSLAQTATLVAEDADCLNLLAESEFLRSVRQGERCCDCDAAWLLKLPAALGSRVVRLMWNRLGAAGLLTYQQTRQVLELAYKGSSNKRLMLPGKTCAVYSYGRLMLMVLATPAAVMEQKYSVDLAELRKAGVLRLELANGILSLGYRQESSRPSAHAAVYPWHLLQESRLEVRQRRDGDRFFPAGGRGSKKLKKYLNDKKVLPEQRNSQLLVACGQQVLWLPGDKAAGWHEQEQECGAWLTLDLEYFSLGDDK